MWDNALGRHLRRTSFRLLWVNALIVFAVLIVYACTSRYLYNFFFGPFPVDIATLAEQPDPGSLWHYYIAVSVPADNEFSAGTETLRKTDRNNPQKVLSETQSARYQMLLVEGPIGHQPPKFLLVKAAPDAPPGHYRGALVAMPPEVLREIVNVNEAKQPQLQNTTLRKIMVDATGFRGPGWWLLGIDVPIMLLGLFNMARAARRLSHPEYHPALLRLSQLGPPGELIEQIGTEFDEAAQGRTHIRPVDVTRRWLLLPRYWGIDVVPLADVMWAFKKRTKHSVNFIPTGSTFAAVICVRDGRMLEVTASDQTVDGYLHSIAAVAPWILAGYAPELHTTWQKQRQVVIDAVDQRRQKIERGEPLA